MSLHPPPAGKAYRWADAPPEVAMKISEVMSIEDLVAIVFDEDDEYSWSSKSEARNAIIRKFNAAQQPLAPDAVCVCGNTAFYEDKVLGVVCTHCQAPRR